MLISAISFFPMLGASLTWVVPPSSSGQSLKSLAQWTGRGEIGLTGKWKVCRFSIFTMLPLFSQFGICCFNLAMKMVRCITYHSATCFFPLTIYHGHFSKSGPVGHSHSVQWLHGPPLGDFTRMYSVSPSTDISVVWNLLFTFVVWSYPYELTLYSL